MTPNNTCGHCVEHYTPEFGWRPSTEPMTEVEAKAQLEKLDVATHRVYWAFKTKGDK